MVQILDDIKALQPCKLVEGGPGGTKCEDGSDPTERPKKGLLGLGMLGLAQKETETKP